MDEEQPQEEQIEQNEQDQVTVIKTYDLKSRFFKPTGFSKGLSLVLFVIIPLVGLFVGFNAGYNQGFSDAKDIQQSYQFTPIHKRIIETPTENTTTTSTSTAVEIDIEE